MPSSCRNLGSYLIHVFLRCSMTKVFYEKRSYRSICNSNGILYVVICEYNNFFVIVFGLIRFFTEYFSFPLWPSRFQMERKGNRGDRNEKQTLSLKLFPWCFASFSVGKECVTRLLIWNTGNQQRHPRFWVPVSLRTPS